MKAGKRGVAIVGTGLIARFHAQAVKASEKVELVAAVDIAKDRVEKFAAEFGCRAFSDLAAALAGGHPLGAACAAIMIKYLSLGTETMNGALYSREMGEITLALILYCCACLALLSGKGGRKA